MVVQCKHNVKAIVGLVDYQQLLKKGQRIVDEVMHKFSSIDIHMRYLNKLQGVKRYMLLQNVSNTSRTCKQMSFIHMFKAVDGGTNGYSEFLDI